MLPKLSLSRGQMCFSNDMMIMHYDESNCNKLKLLNYFPRKNTFYGNYTITGPFRQSRPHFLSLFVTFWRV